VYTPRPSPYPKARPREGVATQKSRGAGLEAGEGPAGGHAVLGRERLSCASCAWSESTNSTSPPMAVLWAGGGCYQHGRYAHKLLHLFVPFSSVFLRSVSMAVYLYYNLHLAS
jgi:hypothetical protein